MFPHQWPLPTSSEISGHDPRRSAYLLPVFQIDFKSMTSAPPRGPIGRGDLAFPFLRPAQPLPRQYICHVPTDHPTVNLVPLDYSDMAAHSFVST